VCHSHYPLINFNSHAGALPESDNSEYLTFQQDHTHTIY